jgi:DNA polymerase-1
MTLILLDAKNAIYRFGFAHKTLTNSEGLPTGAVYGILGALVRLKRLYPDGQFVMVWDGVGQTWRHRLYAGYKSNRFADTDKPDEVKAVLGQIDLVKRITRLMSIPHIEVPTVEADDLIGLAAIMQRAFGLKAVVYSSDKDFMQLMGAGVTVIRPQPFAQDSAKKRMAPETKKSVMKQFGCLPEDILKVRAFAGDTSDAIPTAIAGIGPKRALACIKAGADPSKDEGWKTVTDLKLYGRLREHWADVRRNYKLMQIVGIILDTALFGHEATKLIKENLDYARRELRAGEGGCVFELSQRREKYWEFLCLLVELDLLEALENRLFLWRIQCLKKQ